MLENHSFDNMFAMSGIPGITAAPENVIEVVLTSGERLRIPADPATLRMVLAVLHEQPPS
jgi:hypothetical protein